MEVLYARSRKLELFVEDKRSGSLPPKQLGRYSFNKVVNSRICGKGKVTLVKGL